MSVTQSTQNSQPKIVVAQPIPTQMAVIAPLETEGPITYQTLLEYLDAAPIPYQLWLLTQVSETAKSSSWDSGDTIANLPATESDSTWSYSPEFSPVNGVDATPVAWPTTAAPRVITIQYEGLAINQAVNWAIRQAHGDMILVLDSGLSGLMQLRQALDEIAASIAANRAIRETKAMESLELIPAQATVVESELPVPGAFSRRLIERLEQWGVAVQRQATKAKERRNQPQKTSAATESVHEHTISRVDGDSRSQPAKKLPKFITRFHEFI
ncbi:MAG: hypothetical protein JNL67_14810 [Planctomycetaceae bacterium]|nr:hypothetical protein [Planctomycetaceae bacterium]